jgi:predicted secreted Zn-dependent protease
MRIIKNITKIVIGILGLIAIIGGLIVGYVPAKYLHLPVNPEVVNSVIIPGAQKIIRYDVQGADEATLEKAMMAEQKTLGGVGDAEWNIQAVYKMDNPNTPECKIVNVTTTYMINVTLPRWTDPQDGSFFMNWEWNNFIRRVADHEEHHVQIVLNNIDPVKHAIETSSCENAQATFDAEIARIKQLQADFDTQQKNQKLDPINLQ